MNWKREVWFRKTGIVPHIRITNIDIGHAPGISPLSVQKAINSGQAVPEILIEGIEHQEELRELIRSLVRQPGTVSNGKRRVTVPERGSSGNNRPEDSR